MITKKNTIIILAVLVLVVILLIYLLPERLVQQSAASATTLTITKTLTLTQLSTLTITTTTTTTQVLTITIAQPATTPLTTPTVATPTPITTPTTPITTLTLTPTPTPTPTPRPTYTPRNLRGYSISGAGASFQYPQISQWARLFQETTGAEVTYQSVGSGAGQRMFLRDRVVDFAASDPPLTREQYEQYKGQVMQIPWIMGAVAVVYNVPEIPKGYNLRLTAEVIAKIYKGEIEYWNDPAIRELNPEIANRLPRQPIIGVHRSDSSGTTEIFTTFLNKAAPNEWPKDLVGKVVDWPITKLGRGIGAKGNEGVTATVLQTPYSIGYVELSYAIENNLPIAAVRNSAGRFVLPTEDGIKNAVKGVSIPRSPTEDFSQLFYDIIYSPNPDSYPISSVVFVILWTRYEDSNKALALSEFLKWIAYEGYKHMITGYVAPPEPVVELLLEAAKILEGQR